MEIIIIAVLAIVLFLCSFLGFREGLRLGVKVSKGEEIKPIFKPEIKAKERTDTIIDGLNAIMTYTGDLKGGE